MVQNCFPAISGPVFFVSTMQGNGSNLLGLLSRWSGIDQDRVKLIGVVVLLAIMVMAFFMQDDSGFHSLAPAGRMDCKGAAVCGVLALESGVGTARYDHWPPYVHGLWPQVYPYGNSACRRPTVSARTATGSATCYKDRGFQAHEWEKHGVCAGVRDSQDFFVQVCSLASKPLNLMTDAGRDLKAQVQALMSAGYFIWKVDIKQQRISLSACGTCEGEWHLVPPDQFTARCGGACAIKPPPPPPAGSALACVPNKHGPPCASNADCKGKAGCLRCARSGFCTDVPLPPK